MEDAQEIRLDVRCERPGAFYERYFSPWRLCLLNVVPQASKSEQSSPSTLSRGACGRKSN